VKTLIIMRHAKSDWGDPQLTDLDRPLNARGRAAAEAELGAS
jgi:phosphohistidine phosphatase